MANPGKCLLLALGIALVFRSSPAAMPSFSATEIEGPGSDILFADLDGDRRSDAILLDGLQLAVFYQDSGSGYPRKPQQSYRLADQPSLVWTARLGSGAESVLVMTSEGITELGFTNRNAPPVSRPLIAQHTIVPEKLNESHALFFPWSARTGTEWPLLLVPAPNGLQVWQHRETWRQVQRFEHAVDASARSSGAMPGYVRSFGVTLSIGDVNGDGRDDLMLVRSLPGGFESHSLHIQTADGRFTAEPALTYTNKVDGRTALCWVDFNSDGRLDLVRSTFLEEPFFVPGMHSGKVLVTIHPADERGRIPAEPQQVFRKNDWSSTLPVVDLDGDGFKDLVLGYVPLSTREGLRKMVLARQIDYELRFHFYTPGAGFSQEPECRRNLLIHFDRDVFFNGDGFAFPQLVRLEGDFNGDGKKDLLVRDRSKEISVYFFVSRKKGFSPEADLRFNCPEPIEWCEAKDLNGDGISDLIVKLELQSRNVFRVYLSQTR